MRSLNRFESNLLHILQCLFGQAPLDQALPLLIHPQPRPACLTRDAVELIEQTLSRGVVMMLTRGGAWASQRHLRGDEIREGSLWQRTEPSHLGLQFSPASLDFLIWLTEVDVSHKVATWVRKQTGDLPGGLTTGDRFLLYLAARTFRHVALVDRWFERDFFQTNGLIALTLAEKFAGNSATPNPNFDP